MSLLIDLNQVKIKQNDGEVTAAVNSDYARCQVSTLQKPETYEYAMSSAGFSNSALALFRLHHPLKASSEE